MSPDEMYMIGELKAGVKSIQDLLDANLPELHEKVNKATADAAYIRGKLETYHTPLTCPHGAAVQELQRFKARLLGMAAAVGFLFSFIGVWIKEKIFRGG